MDSEWKRKMHTEICAFVNPNAPMSLEEMELSHKLMSLEYERLKQAERMDRLNKAARRPNA